MAENRMMMCVVCRESPATVGLLCEDCGDEIASPLGLVPQQLLATVACPTDDVVVDQWGRAHPLERNTIIGRALDGPGLQILDASVSRKHASMWLDADVWHLKDLGSANGTYLGDTVVAESAVVGHGARVAFGSVSFYLVRGLGSPPEVMIDDAVITTVRSTVRDALPFFDGGFDDRADTDVGLPRIELRLVEPTGGGGGVLEMGDAAVKLPRNQLELVAVLARRMVDEEDQPAQVRGFVRSSELIASISWDARDPDDNHLRQLIRRLRRALIRAGIGDLIESRHSFGYRLRVIPLT